MNLQYLRDHFDVEIVHVRDCGRCARYQDSLEPDRFLSKREFYEGLRKGELWVDDSKGPFVDTKNIQEGLYGDFVRSTGGFTQLTVTTRNGEVYKTKHNFGQHRFVKSIGVEACVGKMFKKLSEVSVKIGLDQARNRQFATNPVDISTFEE